MKNYNLRFRLMQELAPSQVTEYCRTFRKILEPSHRKYELTKDHLHCNFSQSLSKHMQSICSH